MHDLASSQSRCSQSNLQTPSRTHGASTHANRPDATLKELSQLLKDVVPPARKGSARLEFKLVYPGPEGRAKMRVLGVVRNNVRGAADDARTLKEMRCVSQSVRQSGSGWLSGRLG